MSPQQHPKGRKLSPSSFSAILSSIPPGIPISLTGLKQPSGCVPIAVMPDCLPERRCPPWNRELPEKAFNPGKLCLMIFSPVNWSPHPLLSLLTHCPPQPSQGIYSVLGTALGARETRKNKTERGWDLLGILSIHLFMQQMLVEHLLCTGCCFRCWGYRREQTEQRPRLCGVYILVRHQINHYTNDRLHMRGCYHGRVQDVRKAHDRRNRT